MIGVDQAVIRRVWLVERREARSVLFPGEVAAVHDGSAQRGAVAAHKLGQRMNDNVRAKFDRPQQDRRSDRIVDDQRHAVPVCHLGQRLNVADISCRIANAFAEHRARLLVDQLLNRLRADPSRRTEQ